MLRRFLLVFALLFASQVFPQSSMLREADSLSAVGKTKEAISLLKSTGDQSEKTLLKLANFQKKENQNEEALKNYKIILQNNPARVLTALDYGELLLEERKLETADSLFRKLTKRYPDNASFRYRLGLVHEKQKDSTAIKDFFKTVALDSTHQGALYKTAKFELQNGRHFNATKLAQTGLKVSPNNKPLLSILGQSYVKSLQFEKAIIPYEKLVSLGEKSEFILEQLGKAYRTTGQTEKAINIYKKLLSIDAMNAYAHSTLGVLFLKQNETKKATRHFAMALVIKNQPVDSEYVNLGLAFKREEKFKEAYHNFKMALEENPRNQRARLELAIAADSYFKDKESVLKLYENYVERFKDEGRKDMLSVAEYRISALKKEIHMAE